MSNDLTVQVHQYLTSAPGSLFAQQEVEMLDHWAGDANLLWRVRSSGQEAVVKLFLDAGQARSRRQFDAHQLFAPLGLAPLPLWADRYPHGLSRQLMVYRWVEGERINPNDPGELLAWAEAISRLHTTPADELRRVSPHPINLDYYWRIEQGSLTQVRRWLAESGLAVNRLFDDLAAATEQLVRSSLHLAATAVPTPTHGDLSSDHTLLARGNVLLLDWEMCGLGDPALDVARLLHREEQSLVQDQRALWLDRYLQIVDHAGLAERIDLFHRLLEVHNVTYLLVGLEQHASGGVTEELQSAMPFIQTSLAAALERATTTFAIDSPTDITQITTDFAAWLNEGTTIGR